MGNEELVYDGFHKVVVFDTEIKGKTVKRERILVKSAVAAFVTDEKNRIGLVSQVRPAIQKRVYELPAGLLDKEGLTPIQTLFEELEEECGVLGEEILNVIENPLHRYHVLIGSSDADVSIYRITVKEQPQRKEVSDADVDFVMWLTLDEMQQLIQAGDIVDAKTILAYYLWLQETVTTSK